MKKILFIASFVMLLIFTLNTDVYAVDVSSESELITAIGGTDATITLTGDVILTKSLEVGREVTLDLKGFNITAADEMTEDSLIIVLHGGSLTIEGTGSISATNANSGARIAVKMTKGGNPADVYNNNPAKLVLNSGKLEGKSFGISGNGNDDRINTIIQINGGTVKGGVTGIYHPQVGQLTINGGTVEGETGIEMRSGDIVVNGGLIIGTGTHASSTGNLSGTTTVGAGIAVAQHTTEKNISVVIKGGKIQGYSAVYESNPQSNTTIDKVVLKIEGGIFEAINNGTTAVYSEDKTGFIVGGTFNTKVDEYVDTTLESVKDETTGEYFVGTLNAINVSNTKNGTVKVSSEKAVEGQPITITAKAKEGYKVGTITVKDASGNKVTVKKGKFTMPASEVTVSVTFTAIPVDNTPATGSVDTILVMSAVVALVAVVGIIAKRKVGNN